MDLRETALVIGGFLIFFGMLFFTSSYTEHLKKECRLASINKSYTAVEVQAICK